MAKRTTWLLSALLVAATGTAFAANEEHKAMNKDEMSETEKACEHWATFQASVDKLAAAGPQTTVGELKSDATKVREDLKSFAKAARKAAKPEAENVDRSVERLHNDATNIPENVTVEQARNMIKADVQQVQLASQQLQRKLDCAMGGAGEQGMGTEQQMEPKQGDE